MQGRTCGNHIASHGDPKPHKRKSRTHRKFLVFRRNRESARGIQIHIRRYRAEQEAVTQGHSGGIRPLMAFVCVCVLGGGVHWSNSVMQELKIVLKASQ